ncbi:MAG TPA: thiamine pyrophosphate-dependent enzyme [Rhodopila sp.]|uniref:thiamine pyrophosphate-dependent enzyme n=1 Tax=Rhodopila sp. TaxID=2480087 RepID=UPI002B95077A|nr:thiamine pyrophosphate-dependent enzyme [Rhodopila sp.]HVY14604.1 thiamine pyrophosphate-dependent enzyme [Rhodopila sp.]
MMYAADVLALIAEHRGDAIVISGRGGRHWMAISDTVMDLPLGDPAMGGHAGFGLGLALAQPDRRVILFDSEGDILMSLGQLPTIAEQAPANFYHFVLDNEVYATTGGQPVPNAGKVDYAAVAKASGYPSAYGFDRLESVKQALPRIMAAPGPVFVALKVAPEVENTPIGQRVKWRKRGADLVVADLRAALGVG